MSEYEDRISLRQLTIEIPAADLLSCIWYRDGSGAQGLAGVDIEGIPDVWRIWSIQTLGDRPDIVRMILVPFKEDST